MALLASATFIKSSQHQVYRELFTHNDKFSELMRTIITTATKIKLINLQLNQNKDPTNLYKQLVSRPNIAQQTDEMASYFEGSDIAQTWPSLRLSPNGSLA